MSYASTFRKYEEGREEVKVEVKEDEVGGCSS